MNLKVRRKNGPDVKLLNLEPTLHLSDLKKLLHDKTNIKPCNQTLLVGYPPKPICENDLSKPLQDLGVVSGAVLILTESETTAVQITDKMIRIVIDADNSCLFNAIGYALGRGPTGSGMYMRELVRDAILGDPKRYNEIFLGRPVYDYCAWIQDDHAWGGEIELSILSAIFKVEIMAFDIMSLNKYCYGEEHCFSKRIFLLYDGIHYDVIAQENANQNPQVVTMFDPNDLSKVEKSFNLVMEFHEQSQYTNVAEFTLVCLVCRKSLRGQKDAQDHASVTGHSNFGEVKK